MSLRCQKELLHDSGIKFALFLLFPSGVAHARWYCLCIQFAQPYICGTGVSDLRAEPGQTFCCWIPRICLAVQAHDTLPIFERAAVSQEADSFPLCQSSRAQAEDGSKRLFMAASILSQGTLRCSCFFLEAKFSPFLHIPKQQDYFCLLVPLTPVSER